MTSIASFEQTPLLEIRTEAGAVYLCPSRLQRMRLQWTFRHFHVLPPQVLSRHDQRLIERLSQSAVVTPPLPVASEAILGVVEKAGASSSAYEFDTDAPSIEIDRQGQRQGQRWVALGAMSAAAIGVTVLLASVHASPRHTPLVLPVAQGGSTHQPMASGPATTNLLAVAPDVAPDIAPAPLLQPRRLSPSPAGFLLAQATSAGAPRPSTSALGPGEAVSRSVPAEPVAADHPWITDLPPGHFAHPVVAQRNLAGEVDLQALIAANGSVKQVTVPPRATRSWRRPAYARCASGNTVPFAVNGTPVEAETRIKMNFFGADTVSITSVGK